MAVLTPPGGGPFGGSFFFKFRSESIFLVPLLPLRSLRERVDRGALAQERKLGLPAVLRRGGERSKLIQKWCIEKRQTIRFRSWAPGEQHCYNLI